MTIDARTTAAAQLPPESLSVPLRPTRLWRLLLRDPMAVAALVWLLIAGVAAMMGTLALSEAAASVDLSTRNFAPFSLEKGWLYFLGADSLGRSELARLCVGAATTIGIGLATAMVSLTIGTTLGMAAGYFGGVLGTLIMRGADIILSFPGLLLALVVLYVLGPSVFNLIIVLSIARLPVYVRVARAEVLEIRERMFVDAARSMGSGTAWIIRTHILPILAPTMLTLAAVNLAMVMLLESGLTFLGLGIQPPAMSWGLLIAQGRSYLSQAWWLATFPGLAIMLTTLSFNVIANWFRTASDPQQRWRLEKADAK